MGRPRIRDYHADRIIDLDILLYADQRISTDDLVLPHPHMHERDFVLQPLAEIAGDWLIPGIGTVADSLLKLESENAKSTKTV